MLILPHPSGMGYQEPSGVFFREFDPYRFLRPTIYTPGTPFYPASHNISGIPALTAAGSIAMGNTGDGILFDLDSISPHEYFRGASPLALTAEGRIDATSWSAAAWAELYYNFNDYDTIWRAYKASGVIDGSHGPRAAQEILRRQPIHWLYYDNGPSGNFTRRFARCFGFPLNDKAIVYPGEEPVNFPVTSNTLENLDATLFLPWHQTFFLLRQLQRRCDRMFTTPTSPLCHPSVPTAWQSTGLSTVNPVTTISGSPHGFTGRQRVSTPVAAVENTRVSGIPIPQFDLSTSLKLNNLNVQPTGWITEMDFNRGGFVPGASGRVGVVDMAQQVGWPLQYLRNVNCIVNMLPSRPNGYSETAGRNTISGVVTDSLIDFHESRFPVTIDGFGNPVARTLVKTFNQQDVGMDIYRSEVHFGITNPTGVTISFSGGVVGSDFFVDVMDRFGNVRSNAVKFRWVPTVLTSLVSYNECNFPGPNSVMFGGTLFNAGYPKNLFAYVGIGTGVTSPSSRCWLAHEMPTATSIVLDREIFGRGNGNIQNYLPPHRTLYSTFSRPYDNENDPNGDPDNFHRGAHPSHSPFFGESGRYMRPHMTTLGHEFHLPTGTPGVEPVYNNHCFTNMHYWTMQYVSGGWDVGNFLQLTNTPSPPSISTSDIALSIGGVTIPIVKHSGIKVIDEDGRTRDNWQLVHGYTGASGAWTMVESGYKGRETSPKALLSPFDQTWTIFLPPIIPNTVMHSQQYVAPDSGGVPDFRYRSGFKATLKNGKGDALWDGLVSPVVGSNYPFSFPLDGCEIQSDDGDGNPLGTPVSLNMNHFNSWQDVYIEVSGFTTVESGSFAGGVDEAGNLNHCPGSSPIGGLSAGFDAFSLIMTVRETHAAGAPAGMFPAAPENSGSFTLSIPGFSVTDGQVATATVAIPQAASSWWPAS